MTEQSGEAPLRTFLGLPEALKPLAAETRWVVWKFEKTVNKSGKVTITKVPYQASHPEKRASSTNPKTWSDFKIALDVYEAGKADGIGYCLFGGEISAFDLDDCRNATTGEIEPAARKLIERAKSYVETTVSGEGLRILLKSTATEKVHCKQSVPNANGMSVESYRRAERYIIVTGNALPEATNFIAAENGLIDQVVDEIAQAQRAEKVGREESEQAQKAKKKAQKTSQQKKRRKLDLDDVIENGEQGLFNNDRSRAVWYVINEMIRRGDDDSAIAAVLLDRGNKISEHLYDQSNPQAYVQKQIANARADAGADRDLVTEDSVALAFTEQHRATLRFDHDIGKWFVWNGQVWRCERTRLAFCWARELARTLVAAETAKVRVIVEKTTFASGVERFAQADRALAVTADNWDRDLYLLGTPGGTVDLRTGILRPPQADDFISKQTAVMPAASADCPLWLKFLHEATRGDDGLIGFLQQFCGYALTGDTKEHVLLFVYGPGGNGKGVFQNTIGDILGDYRCTAAMDTFVASPSDKHPTDLAMLRGARLVMASETEDGRAWAESKIKQITGGDKISARFMRQDFFEYKPQFKLLLIGNHKPALRNVDDAARRRFNIVPFMHKPPVRDKDLESKLLKAEGPAILRWMIDGCLAWQRDGLVRPQIVRETTEEYFAEQDAIRQWVEECCDTETSSAADTASNLFKSWSAWATSNGEKSGSSKWFSQTLARAGFKPYRTNKSRGFLGIEVKPETARAHWSTGRDE